jgi:hypothetical protein
MPRLGLGPNCALAGLGLLAHIRRFSVDWWRAVLAYLLRYSHRVAISNSRLVSLDEHGVTFRWKDYRAKGDKRHKPMTLDTDEFMRRFLLHVLPGGFHRIRHYGLLAIGSRKANLAKVRQMLLSPAPQQMPTAPDAADATGDQGGRQPGFICVHCGQPMKILQTFERGQPLTGAGFRSAPKKVSFSSASRRSRYPCLLHFPHCQDTARVPTGVPIDGIRSADHNRA